MSESYEKETIRIKADFFLLLEDWKNNQKELSKDPINEKLIDRNFALYNQLRDLSRTCIDRDKQPFREYIELHNDDSLAMITMDLKLDGGQFTDKKKQKEKFIKRYGIDYAYAFDEGGIAAYPYTVFLPEADRTTERIRMAWLHGLLAVHKSLST